MNYTEALQYIHKTDWKGSRLGLERIKTLCHALGDPQKYLHFVHVAGTNGKGSVSTMLTSILSAAGYRVGLFTSPFLSEFRERIRIGEKLISEADLIAAVEAVRPFADAMEDAPTEFELMTALAFWYFRRQHCDLVVCEVGLGGELDSTNVIEKPLLSVITSIALDHTRELGNTLSAVARAKSGIVKRDRPVLFGEPENSVAASVISSYAEKLSAPYFTTAPDALCVHETTLSGTVFSYRDRRDLRLSLCGAYQPKNAAVVLDAVDRLRGEGLPIS
ncbi:MAG: bifunctional folylpolyglutamate synthase/dihydrofolate synthase, partial [Clostridia bacterium]|nr:bifunctional folylpolyglutamate synthase/dihydrofolate synthase [Clostridia bacterium]